MKRRLLTGRAGRRMDTLFHAVAAARQPRTLTGPFGRRSLSYGFLVALDGMDDEMAG